MSKARPMNQLVDSLIAQWRRCGGTLGDCKAPRCARCRRGLQLRDLESAR